MKLGNWKDGKGKRDGTGKRLVSEEKGIVPRIERAVSDNIAIAVIELAVGKLVVPLSVM